MPRRKMDEKPFEEEEGVLEDSMENEAAEEEATAGVEETKEERFIRLANARFVQAAKRIRLLKNLASPNYKYSHEQVERLLAALDREVEAVEKAFAGDVDDDVTPLF